MKTVFADTVYWIALLNRDDWLHDSAVDLRTHLGSTLIVTSEMVLTEVLNHFSAGASNFRTAVATFIEEVYEHPNCRVVHQTSGQFREALRLYKQRHDKQWSLTDCASILIMQSERIGEVLTHDKHFTQAGFTVLLRSDP
jgi:predicted nucleic acid-binding protein